MVLVLLFTLLCLGIGAAGIAHSIWTGRWFLVRRIVLGLGLWVVGYGVILMSSSLASREQLLGVGEVKRFCGFYLDCHIGVALRGVRVEGSRYLVTLVVTSDARCATLTPSGLRAVLEDRAGNRYERPIGSEGRLLCGGACVRSSRGSCGGDAGCIRRRTSGPRGGGVPDWRRGQPVACADEVPAGCLSGGANTRWRVRDYAVTRR